MTPTVSIATSVPTSTANAASTPPPIEDLDVWLAGFLQPTVWVELLALVLWP
jgi:hypothetical protein